MPVADPHRSIGRYERIAVIAALLVLAILAVVVQFDNAVTRGDADLVRSIADARSGAVVDVADAITQLGNFLVLLPVTALFGLAARLRLPQLRRPFTPLAALLVVSVVNPLLKLVIDRPRPPSDLAAMALGNNGFPSGHAAQSMAAWLSIALVLADAYPRLRGWFVGAGVTIAVLVGVSRVVLGVHSPTDVLGGWAVGLVCAVLIRRVRWSPRSTPSALTREP